MFDTIINLKSNYKIIITFLTTSSRFLSKNFDRMFESLLNQLLKINLIIINIIIDNNIKDDVIFNKINLLESSNIKFNISNKFIDNIRNVLKENLDDDDRIIILADNYFYDKQLTYFYELGYQLYTCDMICINSIKLDNNLIFYDDFNYNISYNKSFSVKYKYLKAIEHLYYKILEKHIEIEFNINLLYNIFYKLIKLYTIGINLSFEESINNLINIEEIFSSKNKLELIENIINNNYDLDKLFLNKDIYIKNIILPRTLLFNIKNLENLPIKNDFHEKHIDLKFINNNSFFITIFYYNYIPEEDFIYLLYNSKQLKINIKPHSRKQTYIFNNNNLYLKRYQHKNYNFNIIQTYKTNLITKFMFYSLNTILSLIPDITYFYFTDLNIEQFYKNLNLDFINLIIEKINSGTFKSDLFRIFYLYLFNGIYFDCKMSLVSNIHDLINCKANIFVADNLYKGIYNAFMIIKKYESKNIIKSYIIRIIINFYKQYYNEGPLYVSGPYLLKKFIDIKKCILYNDFKNQNWINSFVINLKTNKIIIKNNYNTYYSDNNYFYTSHYHNIWFNRKLYFYINYFDLIKHKINYIDTILCVNKLSPELLNLDIKKFSLSKLITDNINCYYFLIKLITFINYLDGNYFLIVDRNYNFNNFLFIKESLKDIIINCPKFDILYLNHNNIHFKKNKYIKIKSLKKNNYNYILNKKNVIKLLNNIYFDSDNNKIINSKNINIENTINNFNIYEYKYSLISNTDNKCYENIDLHFILNDLF